MANVFSITAADIRDVVADQSAYTALITDPQTGGTADPQQTIDRGVEAFVGWCGGPLTVAANLAMAKPFALDFALHALHAHKAAGNPAYKIPKSVTDGRSAAERWATTVGAALLKGEGGSVPGAAGVEYDAPTSNYGMDKLGRL